LPGRAQRFDSAAVRRDHVIGPGPWSTTPTLIFKLGKTVAGTFFFYAEEILRVLSPVTVNRVGLYFLDDPWSADFPAKNLGDLTSRLGPRRFGGL